MTPYHLLPVLIAYIHSISKSCPFYLQSVFILCFYNHFHHLDCIYLGIQPVFFASLYIINVHIASRLRSLKHVSDHLITTHSNVSHSIFHRTSTRNTRCSFEKRQDVNKFESDAYFITTLGNQFVITLKVLIIPLGGKIFEF